MSHDLFKCLARFVVAAATVATAGLCVVPLLAVATGAYATRSGSGTGVLLASVNATGISVLPRRHVSATCST
jgi:hypothetical protein